MRQRGEQFYQLVASEYPKTTRARTFKSKCCRIVSEEQRPRTVTCGPNQYSQLMEPQARTTMIPFAVYVDYEMERDPLKTSDSIRRTLRELGVRRVRWGQRDPFLEVAGLVEVNFKIDGIDFYATALVVMDKDFAE